MGATENLFGHVRELQHLGEFVVRYSPITIAIVLGEEFSDSDDKGCGKGGELKEAGNDEQVNGYSLRSLTK